MANNVSSSTNNKHAEAVEFVKETLYNNHKIPITNIKKQSKTGYDLFFVKDNKEYYIIVVKVKFEKENSKSTLNAINAKKWDFINQNNDSTYIVAVSEIKGVYKMALYTPEQIWESSSRKALLKYCSFEKKDFLDPSFDDFLNTSIKTNDEHFNKELKEFIDGYNSILKLKL